MSKNNKSKQRKVTRTYSGIPQTILGQGGATVGAFGDQKVIQDYSLTNTLFTYDVPQRKILIYENDVELLDNSTSIRATSVNGSLLLKSGTNNLDETFLRSKSNPRYQSDRGHKYAVSTIIDSAYSIGSIIRFGLGTKSNRVYYEVDSGNVYACIDSNGITTHKELITFPDDWNVDLTKNQISDIIFQYRGAGDYKFYWGNPNTSYLEKIHEIKFLNIESNLSMENPALPIFFEAINNGYEAQARFGCADITSEGGKEPIYEYTRAIVNKTGVGIDENIIAIRIPNTYKGKELTRDYMLERISADSDKKGRLRVFETRDTTCLKKLGADLIDSDWNIALMGSALEYNITADSYDINKAVELRPMTIQANSNNYIDKPFDVNFNVYPGDILFVVGTFTVADVNVMFELGEEV